MAMSPKNPVVSGRMTANLDGEFVVFLIGMRINKPWKVHKWWPVFVAMPRMIRRLSHEDLGMLSYHIALRPSGPILVQYWRSTEQLQAFARDSLLPHLAAWRMFNRRVGFTGDVGFWHETYVVRPGQYETVYGNMPRFGLAVAGQHLPVRRKGESSADRLRPAADPSASPAGHGRADR
jgi:Monooxygenase af470-like